MMKTITRQNVYLAGKSDNKFSLSKLEVDHVFRDFNILLLDSRVCLPFNYRNELNSKTNHKFHREKQNSRCIIDSCMKQLLII